MFSVSLSLQTPARASCLQQVDDIASVEPLKKVNVPDQEGSTGEKGVGSLTLLEKMTRTAMLLKKEAPKIPKVKDMRLTYGNKPYSEPILSEPPKSVVSKLISTFAAMPEVVLALDIETPDWPEEKILKTRSGTLVSIRRVTRSSSISRASSRADGSSEQRTWATSPGYRRNTS